ncbi:hypothetical protein NBRC116494_12640 [Aurantivibrio plasticivorans]
MSAITYAAAEGDTAAPKMVKGNSLLLLYSIIPVLLFVVLFDYAIFDNQLRDLWLPTTPTDLLIWAVIFNFPHIVSSVVTLADQEYLNFYGKKLAKGLLVIVGGVVLVNVAAPMLLSPRQSDLMFQGFFIFYTVYTMYHVLSQQYGIGWMMMRAARDRIFQSFRWLSVLSASLMYIMIFGERVLSEVSGFGYSGYGLALIAVSVLTALTVAAGLWLLSRSQTKLGTMYLASNVAMFVATYAFLVLDYPMFVIMVPRFVHDVTAFMIYSVHDDNRNRDEYRNSIYRFLKFLPIAPMFLCFPLAIVLANGVECGVYMLDAALGFSAPFNSECFIREFYAPPATNGLPYNMKIWMQVMFIVGLFHYYIESFVWRRDSIHRHSAGFQL